jgi:hypothetical protein
VNPGLLHRTGRSGRHRRWVPITWDPADESLEGQPDRASADSEVRPGPRPPTLRPHHRKTAQAGPEALSTVSLPITGGWVVRGSQTRGTPDRPVMDDRTWAIAGSGRRGRHLESRVQPPEAASTDWGLSRWGQPVGSCRAPPACRRLLVDRLLHQPAPEPAPVLLPVGRARRYQIIRSAPGGTSVPGARPPSSGDRRLRPTAACAPAD